MMKTGTLRRILTAALAVILVVSLTVYAMADDGLKEIVN